MSNSWTFGIITDGKNRQGVTDLVESIYSQVPRDICEIILVGDNGSDPSNRHKCLFGSNWLHVNFDENERPGWITKKKNIIAAKATYSNVCILHDYYLLEPDWLEGFQEFGYHWDVCCNPLVNKEGQRHSDWLVNPDYMHRFWRTNPHMFGHLGHINGDPKYICGLPYNVRGMEQTQYVSGGYIVAKREVLLDCPFDETLTWGLDEDVQWSTTFKMRHGLYFNPYSIAKANRPNKWALEEIPQSVLTEVAKFYGRTIRYVS